MRDPRAIAALLVGLCALFAGVGLFTGFAIWGSDASGGAAVTAPPATESERCEAAWNRWLDVWERAAFDVVAVAPYSAWLDATGCRVEWSLGGYPSKVSEPPPPPRRRLGEVAAQPETEKE